MAEHPIFYAIPTPGYPHAQYVAIQYPRGRNVHYGKLRSSGEFLAACGYVPRWHDGAKRVDKKISCQRCLRGPSWWRYPRR